MSDSTVSGKFDQLKGSVKQGLGETFNDQSLANEGAADQVKGHAKEAWGNVKDAAHNVSHSDSATDEKIHAKHDAHNLRESIVHGAEHLKESIQRGLGHAENKADRV